MFHCRNARNKAKAEFKTTAWIHIGQEASTITTGKKKLLNWKAWSSLHMVQSLFQVFVVDYFFNYCEMQSIAV